jgi:peptide/nickel transport system permease protein
VIGHATSRFLNLVPVLFVVTLAAFSLSYFSPGDPARQLLGPEATQSSVDALRIHLGLDRPFFVQYFGWLLGVVHGDFGLSYLSRRPVSDLIAQALPVTLELSVCSLVIGLSIAVPAALASARWRGGIVDGTVQLVSFVGVSMPTFWLGLLLLIVFAVWLRVLPAARYVDFTVDPVGNLRAMALPSLTLGISMSTQLARYLRAGLLGALHSDYVATARMKGLAEGRVLTSHVLRNALIPFVTVVGIQIGYLMSGAVVVEQLFAVPGMGRLALASILDRDYQAVEAVVLIAALFFVLVNFAVDLLYSVLDPRIRAGHGAGSTG